MWNKNGSLIVRQARLTYIVIEVCIEALQREDRGGEDQPNSWTRKKYETMFEIVNV